MEFMKVKLFTYDLRGRKFTSRKHELSLPRPQAVKLAKLFYGGEGFTAVHDDTMAALTPKERAFVKRV